MENTIFINVVNEFKEIKEEALNIFNHLSVSQLNWKPAVDKWSIGQCFDHIMITNEKYFPEFDELIKGRTSENFWAKIPFLPGIFGNLFINALSPSKKKKVKAPKNLLPSRSDIGRDIIQKFAKHQDILIEKVDQMKNLDPDKIIITSAVTKYITYSLTNTLLLFNLHERRHFSQAERVINSEGFPKSW